MDPSSLTVPYLKQHAQYQHYAAHTCVATCYQLVSTLPLFTVNTLPGFQYPGLVSSYPVFIASWHAQCVAQVPYNTEQSSTAGTGTTSVQGTFCPAAVVVSPGDADSMDQGPVHTVLETS
jgi:hypothetical protein